MKENWDFYYSNGQEIASPGQFIATIEGKRFNLMVRSGEQTTNLWPDLTFVCTSDVEPVYVTNPIFDRMGQHIYDDNI